ncbi:MAG TPA: hypothetical protein VIY53_15590 [Acidobacteriaceae bacterium]
MFHIALVGLPLAMPKLFALGHPVWAEYTSPPDRRGIVMGGAWWIVRWKDPIWAGYHWIPVIGVAWAVINIAQKRARKLNIAAIALALFELAAALMLATTCFPFCF